MNPFPSTDESFFAPSLAQPAFEKEESAPFSMEPFISTQTFDWPTTPIDLGVDLLLDNDIIEKPNSEPTKEIS